MDGVRELLLVLLLAGAGVLLTAVAVFGPWYPGAGRTAVPSVVEVWAPGTGLPAMMPARDVGTGMSALG
jgi:hypothetical protein